MHLSGCQGGATVSTAALRRICRHVPERGELDWVSNFRASTVHLHDRKLGGSHACLRAGLPDDTLLCYGIYRRHGLALRVLVDR